MKLNHDFSKVINTPLFKELQKTVNDMKMEANVIGGFVRDHLLNRPNKKDIDINWEERGFKNVKQELLCIWHGFYYDSHRAMTDVDALINLLTHSSYIKDKPIIELISNAKKPICRVEAKFAKFEYKDLLKKRNYRWNDPQTGNKDDKAWCKLLPHEEVESEVAWLNENIYKNNFQGRILEITIMDKYKSE